MKRHNSQRGYFVYELWRAMKTNKDIFVLVGDLGYGMFDSIKKDFPKRFVNTGAAEQSLLDIGVGLALRGKIPICYSATPFLIYRAFETIRNYINYEKIPVILIGGGRDNDYSHDGFSHWAYEDKKVMAIFKNIKCYWPETKNEVTRLVKKVIKNKSPSYLNLRRGV